MSGRIEFTFPASSSPVPRLQDGEPFRILVLGDFSGRSSRGIVNPGDLSERNIPVVDVDTLESVFGRLSVAVRGFGTDEPLRLHSTDDLHPDRLVQRIPALAELAQLRARLSSLTTAPAAAEEIRKRFGAAPEEPAGELPEGDADTLERLLGRADRGGNGRRRAGSTLDGLLRSAVEGQVVPAPDAAHGVYLETVERALAQGLRDALRREDFRCLESAWRSLAGLVGGLETGSDLQVHLLDVDREELERDLSTSAGSVRDTELFRRIAERGPGGPDRPGWSVCALDLEFGPSERDLAVLDAVGLLASAIGAPAIAGAAPSVVGHDAWAGVGGPSTWTIAPEDEARWNAFRRSEAARWVGLSAPRLLLRQPYGPKSEPIDAFDFDEWPDGNDLSALLWGNGAFGCVRILGRRAASEGSGPDPNDLDDLPACTFSSPDGPGLVPCAGTYLADAGIAALLERGIMPWISDRSMARVRLIRFQSLADPPSGLPGVSG